LTLRQAANGIAEASTRDGCIEASKKHPLPGPPAIDPEKKSRSDLKKDDPEELL
jgi:hypothetical protein